MPKKGSMDRIPCFFVVLALFGGYYLVGFSLRMGLLDYVRRSVALATLPGEAPGSLRTTYTGVAAIDDVLAGSVVFAWGDCPSHILFQILFCGVVAGSSILFVVESSRFTTNVLWR
jgi:hypothetical protein